MSKIQTEIQRTRPHEDGAPSAILGLEGVSFAVGTKVLLQPISLSIASGSCTIILGPNGAGKSLLLRVCHGLLQPSSGKVIHSTGAGNAYGQGQAMVFQRPVLLRRSVGANMEYALSVKGVPREQRPSRIEAALKLVGLESLADRQARVLSGGEQQRLAIARAWAIEPKILFLDEPSASLDPAATRSIERIIKTIHSGGTTIFMTTHDLGQARRLAERIVFLHQGRLIEDSFSKSFFDEPKTKTADDFLKGELLC